MSNFKLCLNASTIMTTDIMTQIDVAQTSGFEAIELWFDHIDAFVNEGRGSVTDVRKALDDNGLAVPTCIYLGDWFDSEGDAFIDAWDEIKRRIEIAAVVGASHVIAGPPSGTASYDTGAARYRELLELGNQFGVKPAMEFLGFVGQLNTIEDAMQIMDKSRRNDATTVLDPFHIFRGGGDLESISKLTGSQIAVSHFDDVPAEHGSCRLPCLLCRRQHWEGNVAPWMNGVDSVGCRLLEVLHQCRTAQLRLECCLLSHSLQCVVDCIILLEGTKEQCRQLQCRLVQCPRCP